MKLGSRIDINLLTVFEAIYSRGGVTQAARHLNLSQSAISHALGRLRHAFDDPLFVRSGNALVPTALARSIAEPVRNALRGIDVAVNTASSFDPATSQRSFRIGLRQANETQLFVELVTQALQAAPGISLASVNFSRADLARALAYGDIDLAIDIPTGGTAGLLSQELFADRLVVAVRPGHPRIDGVLDLETYLAADHIIATPRSRGSGAEDEILAEKGLTRRIAVRCQHVSSGWRIVARSDMLLTLLESHAAQMQTLIPMQLLPLPVAMSPGIFKLYWHETSDRDPGHVWLRDLIVRLFGHF